MKCEKRGGGEINRKKESGSGSGSEKGSKN